MSLTWIESAGGPLLLLSRELLVSWSGINQGAIDRKSDYDRACETADYASLIPVGRGEGLVLGDMPMPTAWAPRDASRPGDALLVRWMHADDESSVARHLDTLSNDIWGADALSFSVGNEPLYLFDSAIPGSELKDSDYIAATLPRGTYDVATSYFEPDDMTGLVLHLFRRTGT